ncbi:MAG: YbjQ family protein [Candidatus Poseidoniaceae archaeon]|nr:YbjQ family protein [Candidatus Poseidoniaceae archaeon]
MAGENFLFCQIFFLSLPLFIYLGSWMFGNLHQNKLLLKLETEEKSLQGRANPVTNLSKPSQVRQVDSSSLVMESISVGPSWWQMFTGGIKNLFGGKIHSYDKMLTYGRRVVIHRLRIQAIQSGFDEVINLRVETSMITKKSKGDDKTAAYEFTAYGTAIRYSASQD